jgi:protein-disulfide isomerase
MVWLSIAMLAVMMLDGISSYLVTPVLSMTQDMNEAQIQQVSTTSTLAESLLAGSPPTLGSPSASVTIVEFGDYQCPTCGNWYKSQESAVKQNLIETGKAKLVWRDFDYYGPDSISASKAAYAAGDQGSLWQFHDLLFQNQQTPNNGWASPQNLRKFAQQLGLNMSEFDLDFNSGNYDSLISSNHALGAQAGITETPTFYLVGPGGNIVTIAGAQPESVFDQAVRQLNSTPTPEFSNYTVIAAIASTIAVAIFVNRRNTRGARLQ